MDAYINNRTAKWSLIVVNLFLLIMHTGLLVFFACAHIGLMAYVNVCSVLFYALGFLLLKYDKILPYMLATFIEIMVHMFLAVISVGWDYGFQLYFIACLAVVFYVNYFAVRLGSQHVKGVVLSVISAVMYLTSLLANKIVAPLYPTDPKLAFSGLIVNSVMVFLAIILFFSILTMLATYYEKELSIQATHDKLTGMVNRHFLVDHLESIYALRDMSKYWLAILDIDDFKGINDKYGHLCGDFVLKSMAEMIKEICGDRIVCRWGGEEFVIVGSDDYPDDKHSDPENLLEELKKRVALGSFEYNEKITVNMTVTIGLARYLEGQTLDEWINLADRRLYRGKQSGKNQVVSTDE